MKNLFYLTAFLIIAVSCTNGETDNMQTKCENAVMKEYIWRDNIFFGEAEQANISLDSLKNTETFIDQENHMRMHTKFIQKYEENIANHIGDKTENEYERDYQKKLLDMAKKEMENILSLYTPVNYVIDQESNAGEYKFKQRFFINEDFQIMSYSVLELNEKKHTFGRYYNY